MIAFKKFPKCKVYFDTSNPDGLKSVEFDFCPHVQIPVETDDNGNEFFKFANYYNYLETGHSLEVISKAELYENEKGKEQALKTVTEGLADTINKGGLPIVYLNREIGNKEREKFLKGLK